MSGSTYFTNSPHIVEDLQPPLPIGKLKSKHLVQSWCLDTQRHCLSPSQTPSYTPGAKSHWKQCGGPKTLQIKPGSVRRGRHHVTTPTTSSATVNSRAFKADWLFFPLPMSEDLCPPAASSSPYRRCPKEEGSLRICAERNHLLKEEPQRNDAQPLAAAHMNSNKFIICTYFNPHDLLRASKRMRLTKKNSLSLFWYYSYCTIVLTILVLWCYSFELIGG